MNKEDYEFVKNAIQSYLDNLWKEEEKNEFLVWTESDAQSYLYSCLVNDPRIKDKYTISNRPVLSSINPDKKYIGKAKNVKPFYQPDLLITSFGNLRVERRDDAPTFEKRLELDKKDDSIVVEIKFVQDTNESYGRKSLSKLGELVKDYDKNKKEGHKYIILVFFEKGNESYLTADDIKRALKDRQGVVVFHKPGKSKFD
jgi:hypothetical protein